MQPRRPFWSPLPLLLLTALPWLGCAEKPPGPPPRQAILILLDAARADRFGFAGYPRETTPAIDALASRGLVGTKHFAQGTSTLTSLPRMFYSRYFVKNLFPYSDLVALEDPESLIRRVDDEAISLARAFEGAGFATAAISAHSWIKPHSRMGKEFQEVQDLAGELHRYAPPAEIVFERAREWIEGHRDRDFFLYLHLLDTHFPHAFGEDARAFFGKEAPSSASLARLERALPEERGLSPEERRYVDALYDGSLRYADRQIGELVAFLEHLGRLDDTLIVITSDHGEHLVEVPGRTTHGGPWYDAVARIPLVVFRPSKLPPGRLETFSESVDVAPTMLGLMDVPWPQGKRPDGIDLTRVAAGELPGRSIALAPFGIRDDTFKALLLEASSAPTEAGPGSSPALFDLTLDPLELLDRSSERPEILAELLQRHDETLSAPLRRFREAISDEPPESAFAIASRDFRTSLEASEIAADSPNPLLLQREESATGWFTCLDSDSYWLAARPGALELEISFPLPRGRYEVILHGRGKAHAHLGDGESVELPFPAFGDVSGGYSVPASLGLAKLREGPFRLSIQPADDDFFLVTMIGFRPLRPGQDLADAPDQEHEDQLRALGYL